MCDYGNLIVNSCTLKYVLRRNVNNTTEISNTVFVNFDLKL